ncbi:sensor histidine kinase [Spirochaeta lutea]|uniref:sensor histidine kinase n=1 Tax=Spirochaeta lutea TaxID=1480694 RepID=UPI00068E408A|nr:HAMP domain-containing sensor histidine kinase [Spirochaeta lutea]
MRTRQPAITLFLLTLVFLLLSAMFFLVFQSEISRGRLLTQYQLEQALAQTIALVRSNPSGNYLQRASGDLPLEITGFALYDESGFPLVAQGDAPEHLTADPEAPKEQLSRLSRDDSLIYLRRFASRGFPPPPREGQGFPGELPVQNPPSLLYLKAVPSSPPRPTFFTWSTFVVLVGVLGGAMAWIARILLTNQRYRQTLEAQRSLVTLGEASRTISHEIKNPLNAISLRLGVLERLSPPEAQQDIQSITQEVERLNRLSGKIRQLLVAPQGSPEYLALESFMTDLQRQYPQEIAVPQGIPGRIFIDPDHLRSIFENLITNAKQAGSPPPVHITAEIRRRNIRISVTDRGPGIDPDLLPRLFSPFATTKAQGSGLGLAISRQFAQAAGGDLILGNTGSQGTTLILILPEKP